MPAARTEVRLESKDFSCAHVQVSRLKGREAISQIFSFEILIIVLEPDDIDPAELPGSEVDIVFELDGAEQRRIHGTIASIDDQLDGEQERRTYTLHVYPRASRLTMVEVQEVFLNLTVPDIVKQKLSLVGLAEPDVELRLIESYPKREFVVEFRETDLAFVSRLTEHLGISFFFEEHDGSDRLVFTDHPGGFQPIHREAPVTFSWRGDERGVYRLDGHRGVMPGMWAVQDYNYRLPHLSIAASHEVEGAQAGGVIEYGAHHKTPEEGKALARIRAEEREARTQYFTGESDVPEFAAGATFVLDDHPRFEGGKRLLLVEVIHEVSQVTGTSGGQDVTRYKNTFRAVDAARPYRPARVTPKPRIHGVLTAVIEPRPDGRLGKIAALDEQGRYTVRFLFDIGAAGEKPFSSHRVRMIQQHVGPNYGTHMPLKAGVEVLVVFVDGDPDRPLIVGGAPNPATPSPVDAREPHTHRIKTASGIVIQMRDEFET